MKSFSLGLATGIIFTLSILFIYQLFSQNNSVKIQGVVKYYPKSELHVSYPYPEGYYIETNTIFYLHRIDSKYKGEFVSVRGLLSVKCGRDMLPCFPQIEPESIDKITISQ